MAVTRIVFALLALLFTATSARAELDLPGLPRDSGAYASSLTRHFPAGASDEDRFKAAQKADAAIAKGDWDAAVPALESRLSMGNATRAQWIALAQAWLRRGKPDPQKALLAGWQAWSHGDQGATGVPALLLMADALRAMDRRAQEIAVLSEAATLAPDDQKLAAQLEASSRAAGLLVAKTTTEADADQPRACISFTVPPTTRNDFVPGDWVTLQPPVPDVAVTREGDQFCLSGLPSGRTTRITLRAGLPAAQGLTLLHDTTLDVAMGNRAPNIGFDTRLFVLPRGQASKVTLSSVNLSSVSLRLLRLTERNVASLLRRTKLGEPLQLWTAESLANQNGSIIWTGQADIPETTANKTARTALPLPDVLTTAGPGLYALIAEPGDGTPNTDAGAVQLLLRTDLAPSVWRGTDGLTVQIRDYATAAVRPGVQLHLLAVNNDILGEATTDSDGVARFGAPLLRGDGPLAPASIQAFAKLENGEDFATLDLNVAAFDLSDRGVEGMPHPGPFDSYVWPDRGIYRPGETVQLMALLRDNAGVPADLPAQVTIRRPNGQVFLQAVPPRTEGAAIHLAVPLSPTAPAGVWTAEIRVDPNAPPIGTTSFRVDAFVPERMAVDVGALPAAIVVGTEADLPITARFLYGAPASELSGKASLHLVIDPAPFPSLAGYRIGVQGEAFAPDAVDIDLPQTDAAGHTTLPILLKTAPDTTQALKAELAIAVNDPAGRASRAQASIPVRLATPLIGIKPGFTDDSINADTEAAFDIAAVSPDGVRIGMAAKLRLVRERPNWHLVMRGSLARYETVWRDEPLETVAVAIPADAPLHFARKLPFGRYRLEVSQNNGLAVTTLRFRSGWASSDSPDVPDRVDVSVDRRVVPAGEVARVHIAPPFAGHATVLVLSDRVHSLRDIDVPEGGADIDVLVEASWGPGAYVTVHVFRGAAEAAGKPGRAIGLTWIGVDPAARKLDLTIDAPAQIAPRMTQNVVLHAAPGAWVSLAAIDEGVLRLTRFVSPDPTPHFLGRRRLGLDIRDDWGRLIPPAEGDATLLRQGGDDGGFALPDIPVRTVSLFTPPVQIGADGSVTIPLAIPDFAGAIRLMAVGWQGSRIGAANIDMTVRDPLVAEALLPRFLAPDDETRLAVMLQNVDLPAGDAVAKLSVSGPLALTGPDRLAVTLAPGARSLPATGLRATGVGRGVVTLDISFTGGFHVVRDSAITIRPARPFQTLVTAGEIAPGAELKLAPATERFLPGTWHATASFGAPVRYDAGAMLRALDNYPFACLEQAASRALPLALLPDGPLAGPDRAARLQQMVALVLDRQRFDGGFGLWSGNDDAEPWLSAYATDVLLRARTAGATVPEQAMRDALKFLGDAASSTEDDPKALAAQAYRLYVLAAAGKGLPGAARVLMESLEQLPTPLSRAQLGTALALAHDQPRAEAAFRAALLAPKRTWWAFDDGTAVRDQLAVAVLLKESNLLPTELAGLITRLPGADFVPASLSTQEQAWAAAAAAVLGRGLQPPDIHLASGGPALGPQLQLDGPATVKNAGKAPVWQTVAISGIPAEKPPASRAGMRITRSFLALDGSKLDLEHLHQNTVFVLLLEAKIEDGQAHNLMLTQGLPAGWEIAGRITAPAEGQAVPGMSWLDNLTEPTAQPSADDRYAAIVQTEAKQTEIRLAVRLRAVTPGSFALPGAEIADMYRPALQARQAEGRVKILPLE